MEVFQREHGPYPPKYTQKQCKCDVLWEYIYRNISTIIRNTIK